MTNPGVLRNLLPVVLSCDWRQRLNSQATTLMLLVSTSSASADVIRWGDEETRTGVVSETFVLRYDATGTLLRPLVTEDEDGSDTTANDQLETADFIVASSVGQGVRLQAVLPALRLTTARYADHAALELVGLSPSEWSFLFQALVSVESAYDPRAVSPAGARGLAQLMPDTAHALGVAIDDPYANLDGGARYLLAQMAAFGSVDLALAAYNAGPGAVRRHSGIPPYSETQAYVARVIAEFNRLRGMSTEGASL